MTDALQAAACLLQVEVQQAVGENEGEEPPSGRQLTSWAQQAYSAVSDFRNEVTIRLVDRSEMTALNRDFRGQDKATNVLSFPVEVDPDINIALLGDIVICHAVVVEQALAQHKSLADHYAHMVVHGLLHLCGYDHEDDASAQSMEALETKLLAEYGIADPYEDQSIVASNSESDLGN